MRPHLRTSKNRPTPADRYDQALVAARGWGVRPSSSALYIQSEALQDIAFDLPPIRVTCVTHLIFCLRST